jgi:hypothetical protein
LFVYYLHTVPKTTTVRFTGVSEPFLNPECPDMILWAHEHNYKIVLYTTLVGLTPENADHILHIPFDKLVLHLPDALGNAKIPVTKDYLETLGKILTGVKNIEFMNMGPSFRTNNNENMARGITRKRKTGRVGCDYLDEPAYQVLPNGEVFFCCMTRGVSGYVGSLKENTYWELANPEAFGKISYRMQTDPDSLCHQCDFSYPAWIGCLKRGKSRLFGDEKTVWDLAKGIVMGYRNGGRR